MHLIFKSKVGVSNELGIPDTIKAICIVPLVPLPAGVVGNAIDVNCGRNLLVRRVVEREVLNVVNPNTRTMRQSC